MTRASAARLDRDLPDLPEGMRWRGWIMRAEAAIFASPRPVLRETLAGLVGDACRLEELIVDINDELRGCPYKIVFVAGGFQFRTRPRRLAGTIDGAYGPSLSSRCWRFRPSPINNRSPAAGFPPGRPRHETLTTGVEAMLDDAFRLLENEERGLNEAEAQT
jgi:hypothetical protein